MGGDVGEHLVVGRHLRGIVGNCVQRQQRVCVGGTRAHFRGNPDGFHDLLATRSVSYRIAGVSTDAIRTLRHMRGRHRYQLLGLRGKGAVSEHALAERTKRRGRSGSQASSLFGKRTSWGRKKRFTVRHVCPFGERFRSPRQSADDPPLPLGAPVA